MRDSTTTRTDDDERCSLSCLRGWTDHLGLGLGRSRAIVAGLALLAVISLAGCSDDDDDSAAAAGPEEASTTVVKATEGDGTIKLDRTSSSTGDVEFRIENAGKLTHEFVVLKTDIAEDQLPTNATKTAVDESAPGIEVVGERNSIAAGTDATLSLDDLSAGKYVLICNVPTHYGLGMHATFTVN